MLLQPDHSGSFPLTKWGAGKGELAGLSPHALPFLFSIEGLNKWTPSRWQLVPDFLFHSSNIY